MIYTVTLNPSLDYVVNVEKFETGRVNRTKGEALYPGGKGINVSMVLKNLGQKNKALGFVAGFTGTQLEQMLEDKGIHTDFIRIKESMTRINVKLRSTEETEINGQGPDIQQEDIDKLYQKLDMLQEHDILVLAGSIPDTMPESMYRDIMKHLEKKRLRIVVDATKDLLVNVLEYHPFLVKPNHHELGEIFHVEITDRDSAIPYARKLQKMGAENVLVSMAGEGAVLIAEDESVYQASAPVGKVKNSVGAGDSMVAGFLAGYIEEKNYEKAFKMGVCTGSASAFSDELAVREDVIALLNNM